MIRLKAFQSKIFTLAKAFIQNLKKQFGAE